MPAWSGNKVNPTELNSGNEFTENDQVAIEELNAMVNGGLYAQDFAEALADTPDNSDANNVGTASVELVDNIKGGKTYKKFKFKNLKGQTGANGNTGTAYRAMGVWNSSTPYVNNSVYIDTVQFSGSTYYAKISNTGQSPTDGVENTYWGVLALRGSDSSVTIVQTTGTSTSAVMSQNAVTTQLNLKASNTDLANSLNGIDYLKDPDKTYLVIKISADNEEFKLLTGTTGSPNYVIDWGDRQSESITTTDNLTHEYATAGMYLITISGSFANGIVYSFSDNVNKNKIIELYGGSNYSTSIGNTAFYNCSNLTTAYFPTATSISTGAFNGCESLTTVYFPLVTSIINNAFNGCSNLTTVHLPSAISIDGAVFNDCTSLTTVHLPNATSIDDGVFWNCTSLTTANLPQATYIGNGAFYNCTSLKELTIGNVMTIGTGTAFENVKLINLKIAQDVDATDIARIKQFYSDNNGTFTGAVINSI